MWFVLVVYKHGIQICSSRDFSMFLTACCVNDYDRTKFIADIREAVLEVRQQLLVHYIPALRYYCYYYYDYDFTYDYDYYCYCYYY